LCNGTDIVKVTFRLTVGDLIDNEAVAKYNELKLDNIYIQNKVFRSIKTGKKRIQGKDS